MKPSNIQKKMTIGFTEYVKANRMFARQEELERNGGRWIAKDRPHRNKKHYDRKRDRRIDGPFDFNMFVYLVL